VLPGPGIRDYHFISYYYNITIIIRRSSIHSALVMGLTDGYVMHHLPNSEYLQIYIKKVIIHEMFSISSI
jgi:hypothetical protein